MTDTLRVQLDVHIREAVPTMRQYERVTLVERLLAKGWFQPYLAYSADEIAELPHRSLIRSGDGDSGELYIAQRTQRPTIVWAGPRPDTDIADLNYPVAVVHHAKG